MSLPQPQDIIQASDYNSLQQQAELLLGVGVGTRGYGQSQLTSSSQLVEIGGEFPLISRNQWSQLRQDIATIQQHQTGSTTGLVDVGPRLQVEPDVNANFSSVLSDLDQNRFNLAVSRSLTSSTAGVNYNQSWSVMASVEVTVTFDTPDNARWFFNSGGRIQFFSQRSGGTATPQNTTWTALLNAIGTVSFAAIEPLLVSFYSLTDQNQTVYEFTVGELLPTSIYSNNDMKYRIRARCNIPDNSNGGANQIVFTVEWVDNYESGTFPTGPDNPDLVDGLLSLSVTETKAALPFNISSPIYSVSAVTAS